MTISLAFLAPKLVRAAMVGRAHLGEGVPKIRRLARAREMAAKTAFVLEGAHQGSNLGPADRFAPILLPKSFWGVERKFLEPLVRFARGDVRDYIG